MVVVALVSRNEGGVLIRLREAGGKEAAKPRAKIVCRKIKKHPIIVPDQDERDAQRWSNRIRRFLQGR